MEINISGKVVSGAGDNLSQEGELRDTSVLELDVSKTIEGLLVSAVKESKWIVESKRRLSAELTLECVECGRGLAGLGGGKRGGGGDGGGEDDGLHCFVPEIA